MNLSKPDHIQPNEYAQQYFFYSLNLYICTLFSAIFESTEIFRIRYSKSHPFPCRGRFFRGLVYFAFEFPIRGSLLLLRPGEAFVSVRLTALSLRLTPKRPFVSCVCVCFRILLLYLICNTRVGSVFAF